MQENSQEFSLIKRNILRYLDFKGVSEYQFYKETGVSRGTLKNSSGLTEDNIAKFLAYAPEVNVTWLITGIGDMLVNSYSIVAEPLSEYKRELPNLIPLLPVEAIAGFGSGNWVVTEKDIQERYLIPDFNTIDFMIRVKGSSMYPKYNSGDIVACKKIQQESFIQWNKTHVISTQEQGIMVKRIRKSDMADHYSLISDNKDYSPFDVPKSEITGIAIVIGTIRLE